MDATGYIELWSAILRDVTIISKMSNGQVIFSVTPKYDGGDFSHSETATRKKIDDLIPRSPATGDITISGTEYQYEWQDSLTYVYMLNSDPQSKTFTTTAPYDCKIQLYCGKFNIALTGCGFDWYVNNVKQGNLHVSWVGEYTTQTITLNEGDILKLVSTDGPGTARILPVQYPSLWGTIEEPSIDMRFIVTRKIGDVKWPFISRSLVNQDLYVPASQVTNIVYNGEYFDDYDWYLPSGVTSTFIASIKQVFNEGIFYNTETSQSNSLVFKGKTYSITNFVINGDSVSFISSSREEITVNGDTNLSVSANLHVADGAGSIEILNALPSSTESDLGNGSRPFRNIYGKNFYGDYLSADSITTDKINLSKGSYVIYRNSSATLWSDGYIEIIIRNIRVQDDSVEEHSYSSLGGISIAFRTTPFTSYVCTEKYTEYLLSGTSNIPLCSIYPSGTTFTVSCDFGKVGAASYLGDPVIDVKAEGFLTDSVFSQIKASLGV